MAGTQPMTAERLAEIRSRLTANRLGKSSWRETDADLLAIRDLLAELDRQKIEISKLRICLMGTPVVPDQGSRTVLGGSTV